MINILILINIIKSTSCLIPFVWFWTIGILGETVGFEHVILHAGLAWIEHVDFIRELEFLKFRVIFIFSYVFIVDLMFIVDGTESQSEFKGVLRLWMKVSACVVGGLSKLWTVREFIQTPAALLGLNRGRTFLALALVLARVIIN